MKNKIFRTMSLTLLATLSMALLAGCNSADETPDADGSASGYPEKAITMIVPYAAGGSSDVMARVFEGIAAEYLGQPLVVENITGSGGTIGMTDYLANYKADGYTLVFPSSAPLVAQPLVSELAYNPVEDFVVVAGVSSNSQVLVVPGDSPINTLDELIATYKDAPGDMLYGYPAVASNPYLAQEILFQELGLVGTGVPLGGSADVVTAVLGGHVDVAACSEQEALELYISGDLKILGSFSAQPLEIPGMEEIETFVAMGYESSFANWRPILAHKDTPEAELEFLRAAFQKILGDQMVVDFLVSIGDTSLADMTQEDYVAKVSEELAINDALFQELKVGKYE